MSRPPPPPSFPPPNSNTPNANLTRGSAYPPPGSAYPPPQSEFILYPLGVCAICDIEPRVFLASNYGIYHSPRQSTTYPTSQPHQPPPSNRTRDPFSVNSYAPASTYSYSYSTPTPHHSAYLPPSGPPQTHSTFPIPSSTHSYSSSTPTPHYSAPSGSQTDSTFFPIPSVPGGYSAPTNVYGMPPPSMTQRITTMPTPGQAHNPHSVPYHNVPAPAIFHQPSHSRMSGEASNVTGNRSHCACIVYNVYQNTMFSDRLST